MNNKGDYLVGHLTTNKARGFPSYHHHCWFWRLYDEIDIIAIFLVTRFQSCWTLPSPPMCDTWTTTRCTWAPSSCTRPCHTQGDDVNNDLKFQISIHYSLDNTTTTAAESRWPEESWTRWCLPPTSTHQPFVYWDNWLLSHLGRSHYQKWILKNSCSLLPGDRGSQFWPRNVSGRRSWSEGRLFYSTFPRSQVDDHCQTDQHHLHHHLGYSTVRTPSQQGW